MKNKEQLQLAGIQKQSRGLETNALDPLISLLVQVLISLLVQPRTSIPTSCSTQTDGWMDRGLRRGPRSAALPSAARQTRRHRHADTQQGRGLETSALDCLALALSHA